MIVRKRGSLKKQAAPPKPETEKLLTKQEAAIYLRVTVRGVESWMQSRTVPYYRIGKRSVRFKMSDLQAHLDARYRVPANA